MTKEKYCIDIGEQGSEGLGRLDYCFNQTTKDFLLSAGLKQAKTVLDIGCGSGIMTCWMAEQIGENGKIIAIENDINQLNAAKRNANRLSIHNIEFKLLSAYEIDTLQTQFDFVYCRFVLHHLHGPEQVVAKIFNSLTSKGIYAAEEGIVNYAFSYPFSPAWGDEMLRVPPIWQDAPENQRDGNIGIKMYHKMYAAGFKNILTKIIHPILTTKEEKNLLLLGREEMKRYYLEEGHTEAEWQVLGEATENMVNDDTQIVGFYASCQVAGMKL
jgi:ubiquinone/menaquinone biosynthesis C-methylase UbiE